MIQLVINTTLLREIEERKLIGAYARLVYNDESDITEDTKIIENLKKILDWDINGENGLEIYCGKFESIKRKDWEKLIQIIKENHHEIKSLANPEIKIKKLKSEKIITDNIQKKENRKKERFIDENYKVSGRGKKAKPCIYKGKIYKSRQECLYKEGLTNIQLYTYLAKTGQLENNIEWYEKNSSI